MSTMNTHLTANMKAEADIPEGYTAVSDENFAVSVTRDENGRLISDISEFVVTVKDRIEARRAG